MATAGYSGTPLVKKLGIKEGFTIMTVNAPAHYFSLLEDMPEVREANNKKKLKDFIHFFPKNEKELSKLLPELRAQMEQGGMIWVSWPKKTSKVISDVNEHTIRKCALSMDLVDVKVCAVDETWSGMKLVIRVKDRKL